MAITERLMGAGSFSLQFIQDSTPTEVVDAIQEWGHIVITPQEMDPNLYSDAEILASARYTGIVLNKSLEEGVVSVQGQGLELYLGDGRGKGMVIAETKNIGKLRNYKNKTLSQVIDSSSQPYGILRNESGNTQAIIAGDINVDNISYSYSGSHFVETALSALRTICEILGVEYRVNPDATLDVDNPALLWRGVSSEPTTVVVKTGYGDDPTYTGISPTGSRTEFDARDYVTAIDFIAEVGAYSEATDFEGEASLNSSEIPYYDIHGNKLSRTGLVTVPDMDGDKLDEQAQLMLSELSRVKKVLNLDLEQYEVTGDLKAGDYIYAFDPSIGFKDTEIDATAESRNLYQISFRGQTIAPVKIRVLGLTYPIVDGMGIYFRRFNGASVTYTNLTEYVSYESGDTQVELGDVVRDISDDLRFNEISIAAATASAKSIPDLPATPTLQSGTYQDSTGESKGFIRIVFDRPTNIDGSQITDGSHYRVRYKVTDGFSTSGGASVTDYSYRNFPFTGVSTESLVIPDLTVGKAYRVGVSTVDTSGFKKMSDYTTAGTELYTDSASINANWATNAVIEIDRDGQAPSKPKQAQAIASGPLNVQITHYLGKDGTDGNGNPFGDYTLEGDVDHIDVHAVTQNGNVQDFTVSESTKRGELRVTSGNILQQIPVVGTLEMPDSVGYYFRFVAVDKSGNESDPSDGQTALATLIEEAQIADATITEAKIGDAQITTAKIADATITDAKIQSLTADKITAGTIDANTISVINLNASNITSGTIDAARLNLSNYLQVGDAANDINNGTTTISGGKISANSLDVNSVITNDLDFNNLSINSQNIIDTLVTDAILAKIGTGSITDSYIGSVSFGKITSVAIDAGTITSGTISANRIAADSLSGDKISGGTIDGATLSGGFISGGSVNLGGKFVADNSGMTATAVVTIAPTAGSSIGNANNSLAGNYLTVYGGGTIQGTIQADTFKDRNSNSNIDMASYIDIKPSDSLKMRLYTSNIYSYDDFLGSPSGSYNLGNSSFRWNTVYATNGTINTSDITQKTDVVPATLGLDFVNTLEPIEFKWIDRGDGTDGVRTHLGFSAQDVKQKLIDYKGEDQNYGVYTQGSYETQYVIDEETGEQVEVLEDDKVENYGLRMTEMIPMLTKAIQELSAKVDDLTARIEVLEAN